MSLNKNRGDQNSKIAFPGSSTVNSSRSSIPSSLFHQDLRADQIKVYLKTLDNIRSTMKSFLSNQSKTNNDTPGTLPKPKPQKNSRTNVQKSI